MIRYKCRGGFAPIGFDALVPLLFQQSHFIILDRDGTLVPMCSSPEEAKLSPTIAGLLSTISDQGLGNVAVISARGLRHLEDELDGAKHVLAGNYGLEISFPSGKRFLHPAAAAAQPRMQELAVTLNVLCRRYPRLMLDNHDYSLCLHCHRLSSHQTSEIKEQMKQLKHSFQDLRFRDLPTSYEVLPAVDWDKGNGLDKIAAELHLDGEDLLYLTFGDSENDEPMYSWVNSRHGLSFNVGDRDTSQALGQLESPADVCLFLRSFIEFKTRPEEAGKSDLS